VHEPEVALLDEIQEGQTGGLVPLGNGDDQAQVGPYEAAGGVLPRTYLALELGAAILGDVVTGQFGGCLTAQFGQFAQPDLLGAGQQPVLTDVVQV